jgi:flagellar basal-body rod modification protein FlgD
LLVAQLKNQDPSNPTDPTSFMTEIAQLTAVQSQTTLNAEEQTVAADSMLGQKVTGTGAGGQSVSGTVTSVLLNSSGPPQLTLAGQGGTVALDQVTQVSSAIAAAASTGAASTSTASAGTRSPSASN